jgi:tRNA(Ile)-lysidine synthase
MPELLEPGTRLVVAFSGGQDSTCLLHALHTLMPELDLLAAHVDHGLRPTSAADAQRVVELAASMGVATQVVSVDVAAYRKQRSVQHAARAARYQALASIVAQVEAHALLVAHTADDQAETVLLNLLRGTGLRGLGGMRAHETIDVRRLGPPLPRVEPPGRVTVARPLLGIERATTLAYCAENGLSFVEDASNQSRAYTRNRVRLDLLPLLETFNPAIRAVLARTAEQATDDVAALDSIVADLHEHLARQVSRSTLAYDLASWRAQPRALQRRLLRRGIACLLGTLEDVPAAPIEDALELLRSAHAGQAYHLPYGIELVTTKDEFELRRFGAARRREAANNGGSDAPRV